MPSTFPDRARAAAHRAARWLVRSQERGGGAGGSSAFYMPLRGWAPPYPETTGYIVPTLWRASDAFAEPALARAAEGMAAWLLTLQAQAGWFPGGTLGRRSERRPSVFNTGQILFGLLEAEARTGEAAYGAAARRAIDWLVRTEGADGRWREGAYRPGPQPSYYAHVCWPMAAYVARHGGEDLRRAVVRALDAILEDRTPQGTFRHWGFSPGRPAFTHTIAYTLLGLVESARLLDRWEPYGRLAAESAERLLRRFEVRKRLAGAYDEDWSGTFWYACLTGHCQVASTWLALHDRLGDPRYLSGAIKVVEHVLSRQSSGGMWRETAGAIAGSSPPWGRYMAFRYPNWAAKFFIDAALDLAAALDALAVGPRRAGVAGG
jgi:hypothetical protein